MGRWLEMECWFCAASSLFGMEVACAATTAGVHNESGWTLPTGQNRRDGGRVVAELPLLSSDYADLRQQKPLPCRGFRIHVGIIGNSAYEPGTAARPRRPWWPRWRSSGRGGRRRSPLGLTQPAVTQAQQELGPEVLGFGVPDCAPQHLKRPVDSNASWRSPRPGRLPGRPCDPCSRRPGPCSTSRPRTRRGRPTRPGRGC